MASKPNMFYRISTDLKELENNPVKNITAGPVNKDTLDLWEGTIFGPNGTPYEGGIFQIKISFPTAYPFAPPKIVFLTKIFHCNIKDGEICLDILKNRWSPAISVHNILLSISSLFDDPNPESPEKVEIFFSHVEIFFSHVELELETLLKIKPTDGR